MSDQSDMQLEHFKHVCEQTNYFNDKLVDAFTFYVQTLSAIVGGSIWLVLQDNTKNRLQSAEFLSNGLVILLGVVTFFRVVGNYAAWWNARKKQHELLEEVEGPTWFRSSWMEIVLLLGVIMACWFFITQNPFTVLRGN